MILSPWMLVGHKFQNLDVSIEISQNKICCLLKNPFLEFEIHFDPLQRNCDQAGIAC